MASNLHNTVPNLSQIRYPGDFSCSIDTTDKAQNEPVSSIQTTMFQDSFAHKPDQAPPPPSSPQVIPSSPDETSNSWQSNLITARFGMELINFMDEQHSFGGIKIETKIEDDKVKIFGFEAERIGIFVGIFYHYTQTLNILAEEKNRNNFLIKHKPEELELLETTEIPSGLINSTTNIIEIIQRMGQCNINKMFAPSFERLRSAGRYTPNDIQLFEDVQEDPFYNNFIEAGAQINENLKLTDEAPIFVWSNWRTDECERIFNLSDMALPKVGDSNRALSIARKMVPNPLMPT